MKLSHRQIVEMIVVLVIPLVQRYFNTFRVETPAQKPNGR
jgi:hypothetical protein